MIWSRNMEVTDLGNITISFFIFIISYTSHYRKLMNLGTVQIFAWKSEMAVGIQNWMILNSM